MGRRALASAGTRAAAAMPPAAELCTPAPATRTQTGRAPLVVTMHDACLGSCWLKHLGRPKQLADGVSLLHKSAAFLVWHAETAGSNFEWPFSSRDVVPAAMLPWPN